ncbi:MAG: hypothetical protein ACE5MM_09595 [Nitrospiraceae bacterium]
MLLFYELYILGSLISYAVVSLALLLSFALGLWMYRRFTFQGGAHCLCSRHRVKVKPLQVQATVPSSSRETMCRAA